MKKFFALLVAALLFVATAAMAKETLVIYCGVTMLRPMTVIAKQIESSHDCKVNIVPANSVKLLKLILKNRNGDFYFPGDDSFIKKLENEHPGLVVAKAEVGYNQASIFVAKGNPKGVTSDLNDLLKPEYRVVIGSAKVTSVGKVTKKMLTKMGIYDQVLEKAKQSLHSEGLVNAIKVDAADIVINYHAVSTWEENKDVVDSMPISEEYAEKKKLVLAQLKDSKNPDLAAAFLAAASSPEGHAIFRQYGLTD